MAVIGIYEILEQYQVDVLERVFLYLRFLPYLQGKVGVMVIFKGLIRETNYNLE